MATLAGEHIAVGYGKRNVIEDANILFDKSEIVSIIGPNGSGKSTLLKALSRLLPIQRGRVLLNGAEINSYRSREVAQKIAILPQSATAPPDMNIYKLVSCGRSPHHGYFADLEQTDEEIVEKVMRETDVWQFRERSLFSLSGGERQRVWLAMALAQEPEILMLDEPTTYLDIHHQLNLMDLVTETYRQRRITIIMVLHDLNQAARYSHRMVAMKDGAIVGDGSPADILREENVRHWFGVRMRPISFADEGCRHCFYCPMSVEREESMERESL